MKPSSSRLARLETISSAARGKPAPAQRAAAKGDLNVDLDHVAIRADGVGLLEGDVGEDRGGLAEYVHVTPSTTVTGHVVSESRVKELNGAANIHATTIKVSLVAMQGAVDEVG